MKCKIVTGDLRAFGLSRTYVLSTHLAVSFNKGTDPVWGEEEMKGIMFAFLGGAFITLQGVANAHMSQHIGTWQTATLTQFTGFMMASLILFILRDGKWQACRQVKPYYLTGGALAAFIIFSNVTAIQHVGVTMTIAALLIAQLTLTFLIDSHGWFGVVKQRMRLPHFIGIGMMVTGVVILSA